jgi:hypothetical protein
MRKNNNILKIGVLSLCLMFFLSLSVQAKPGVPLIPKSKSKALSYSLVGTLAPAVVCISLLSSTETLQSGQCNAGIVIGSLGLLCGPGIGHLYAGNSNRFVSGMIIRSLAGGVAIFSVSKFGIDIWGNDSQDTFGPIMGFLVGGVTVVASSLYDISATGESVDRYNKQHGFSQFTLQPRYWPNHQAVGFSLAYRF